MKLDNIVLKIVLFSLMIVTFSGAAMAASFTVNINQPANNQNFSFDISNINVSANITLNTNCTYTLHNQTPKILGSNNSQYHTTSNLNISSLSDSTGYNVTVFCMAYNNGSDNATNYFTFNKNTVSPNSTWNNPVTNNSKTKTVTWLLNVSAIHDTYEITNGSFMISCNGADGNGVLQGSPTIVGSGINTTTYILQNWTTPTPTSLNDAVCVIYANVTAGLDVNTQENITVNITLNESLTAVDFVDFDDNTSMWIEYGYNDTNNVTFYVNLTNSSAAGVNLTHNGVCYGPNPLPMTYDSFKGEFFVNCSVNTSALNYSVADNISAFAYLTNFDFVNDSIIYSFYGDNVAPEIHFSWWNTTSWNISTNLSEEFIVADYRNFTLNPDIFYTPFDNIINFSINATDDWGVDSVMVNLSEVESFIISQSTGGNCTGLLNLTLSSGLWVGSCSLGNFDINNIFAYAGEPVASFNIYFDAFDNASNELGLGAPLYYNTSTNPPALCSGVSSDCMPLMIPINIHDFGVVGELMTDDGEQMGPLTTNLSEVIDMTNISMIVEFQLNLSNFSMNYSGNLPLPSDFISFALFNFSEVDLSTPEMGIRLSSLFDAIEFEILPPGEFGSSYIHVNSSAFSELNTTTTITLMHLPFASKPAIIEGIGAAGVNGATITWSSGPDALFGGMITGNLTFTVYGFSGYNVTDNESPIVTFNDPVNDDFSGSSNWFNVTLNGTGSPISQAVFYIDGTPVALYNATNNSANCVNESFGSEMFECYFAVSGMSSGDNNFSVLAFDYGGAMPGNNVTDFINISVDNVDPVISYSGNASSWVGSEYNLTINATDNAGIANITVILSSQGFQSTSSVFSLWNVTVNVSGNQTVNITAYDIYGNSASEIFYTLLDLDAPVSTTNATSVQSATTIFVNASDSFSGWKNSTYVINGTGLNETNTSNETMFISVPAIDGNYTLNITSYNNVGNVDFDSIWFTVDAQAPVISYSGNASSWVGSEYNLTINITEAFGARTIVYIDGLVNTNTTSKDFTVEINTTGNHSVNITSTDDAGNLATPISFNTLIDLEGPTVTDNAPSGWQSSDFTITLNPTDGLGSGVNYINYSIDGAANITGTSVSITTSANHTIIYYAVDNASNVGTPVTIYATLDKNNPVTTDNFVSTGIWSTSNIVITLSPVDVLSGVNTTFYKIDGGSTQSGTSVTVSTSGNHTVTYWSVDQVANTESVNTISNILVDKDGPTIEAGSNESENSMFNSTLSSDRSTVASLLDSESGVNTSTIVWTANSTNINFSSNTTLTTNINASTEGYYLITLTAEDNLGQSASDNFVLTWDLSDPVIDSFTLSDTSVIEGTDITGTCTALDNLSSVSTSITGINTDNEGSFTATCTATDAAGNSVTSEVNYTVEAAPTTSSSKLRPAPRDVTQSNTKMEIQADSTLEIHFSKEEVLISDLELKVKEDAENVRFTVTAFLDKPSQVKELKKAYKYLEIDHVNLDNENIDGVKIKFKVAKSWFKEHNASAEDVVLRRFVYNDWSDLLTEILSEDNDYVYFEATSPGLSYFAIDLNEPVVEEVAKDTSDVVEPVVEPVVSNSSDVVEKVDNDTTKSKSLLWVFVIIGIVLVGGLVGFLIFEHNHHEKVD